MESLLLQFIRNEVQNVMNVAKQQQQVTTTIMDTIKSYVPKVQQAWIGGDADEFAADVQRKIIPTIMELIAAIAGVNINLTNATQVVDQADSKCKGLATQLGDMFSKI